MELAVFLGSLLVILTTGIPIAFVILICCLILMIFMGNVSAFTAALAASAAHVPVVKPQRILRFVLYTNVSILSFLYDGFCNSVRSIVSGHDSASDSVFPERRGCDLADTDRRNGGK